MFSRKTNVYFIIIIREGNHEIFDMNTFFWPFLKKKQKKNMSDIAVLHNQNKQSQIFIISFNKLLYNINIFVWFGI